MGEHTTHLVIEQPVFEGKPHIWVQWKGTDLCADVHCACGAFSHFDGDFFYYFQCPACQQYWEVGTHVAIYPVTAEQAGDHVKIPEWDGDRDEVIAHKDS